MSFLLTTFGLLVFASASLASASTPKPQASEKTNRILIIGDSLTEGLGVTNAESFPSQLEAVLKAEGCLNCKVINAGTSGSTSAGARKRLEWQLKAKERPQILILALGANDALRGINTQSTKTNLDEVIRLAKANQIKVLLAGMLVPPNYGASYSKEFSSIFSELSVQHKVSLLPFLLDGVAGNPKFNLADGIHPNAEGYKIVATAVAKKLKELL
jgi:acyl-CoA thioesterase-1